MKPQNNGHFARVNALVDRHLALLTEMELKVWLVLHRHANEEGIAYPSPELIANKTGYKVRAIYKALRFLQQKGFLETIASAGGRGKVARRKVCLPKTLSSMDSDLAPENPVQSRPKTLSSGATNPVQSRTKTLSAMDRRTDVLTAHRTTHQQQNGANADDAGDIGNAEKQIRAALVAMKVNGKTLIHTAKRRDITPVHIAVLRHKLMTAMRGAEQIANPAGWIVAKLPTIATIPETLDPGLVCKLINSGLIGSINGSQVSAGVKFNNAGIHLQDGQTIPAAELQISSMTLGPVAFVDLPALKTRIPSASFSEKTYEP